MEAPVIEPVDVLEGGELDVVEASPWSLRVDELPLVEAVERLSHGVIEAVAPTSDRGDDVILGQAFGVADR